MASGIDLKLSLSITLQVLCALEHIHSRGIIHRAIGPHSIFFVCGWLRQGHGLLAGVVSGGRGAR
jgi:hypothetical protein